MNRFSFLALCILIVVGCSLRPARQKPRFVVRKGCHLDTLRKQGQEYFKRMDRNKAPFKVDMIEYDTVYVFFKYMPGRPGGTAEVWVSKKECKVIKESWGQ